MEIKDAIAKKQCFLDKRSNLKEPILLNHNLLKIKVGFSNFKLEEKKRRIVRQIEPNQVKIITFNKSEKIAKKANKIKEKLKKSINLNSLDYWEINRNSNLCNIIPDFQNKIYESTLLKSKEFSLNLNLIAKPPILSLFKNFQPNGINEVNFQSNKQYKYLFNINKQIKQVPQKKKEKSFHITERNTDSILSMNFNSLWKRYLNETFNGNKYLELPSQVIALNQKNLFLFSNLQLGSLRTVVFNINKIKKFQFTKTINLQDQFLFEERSFMTLYDSGIETISIVKRLNIMNLEQKKMNDRIKLFDSKYSLNKIKETKFNRSNILKRKDPLSLLLNEKKRTISEVQLSHEKIKSKKTFNEQIKIKENRNFKYFIISDDLIKRLKNNQTNSFLTQILNNQCKFTIIESKLTQGIDIILDFKSCCVTIDPEELGCDELGINENEKNLKSIGIILNQNIFKYEKIYLIFTRKLRKSLDKIKDYLKRQLQNQFTKIIFRTFDNSSMVETFIQNISHGIEFEIFSNLCTWPKNCNLKEIFKICQNCLSLNIVHLIIVVINYYKTGKLEYKSENSKAFEKEQKEAMKQLNKKLTQSTPNQGIEKKFIIVEDIKSLNQLIEKNK